MRDRTKRRKFNSNYRRTFSIGKVTASFVVVSVVFVLSLLYLSQSNKMALKGYDIAALEQQKQELMAEQERLQIESTRLQSIREIQNGLKDSGMVQVKKINYLPYSSNVAMK